MISIQELIANIRANTTGFDEGVKRVEEGHAKMGQAATAAGDKVVVSQQAIRTEAERTQAVFNSFVEAEKRLGGEGGKMQAAFNKELDITRAKIGEIAGLQAGDKLGPLRLQYKGA